MCKFNHLVLVLIVCCLQLIPISVTSPLGTLLFDDYTEEQDVSGYDLHYDERQNGTENYRLNINDVVIALPSASNSLGLLASNYLLELAEAAAADDETANDDDDLDDDKPYDFEIPSGNHDETVETSEMVINSTGSVTSVGTEDNPENESVSHELKPENHIDAIIKKESETNKKDLTEIINADGALKQSEKEFVIKESVTPVASRRASTKVGLKRNKLKSHIGVLIDYL